MKIYLRWLVWVMTMRKVFKFIVVFIILIIILILIFRNYNLNVEKREAKKINESGAVEKQVKLVDGSIINYGEIENNKMPLLLIHGQVTSWKDYVNVLKDLSKDYHVYALDCYGHGGSSKNINKYKIKENGKDIIWFINNVIKEPVVISGHSSGGLIATWVAANESNKVKGLLIEDAPFFSTCDGRAQKTYAWQGFKIINDFLESDEKSYMEYYLENDYMKNMFNKDGKDNWEKIVIDPALKQLQKNPNKIPRVWYYPNFIGINDIYKMGACIQDGTGDYDLRFGQLFYNFKCFDNFNQEETLKSIKCPSVLMHVAKPKMLESYYDESGVLLSAMDEKDASRVDELLVDNYFMDNINGSSHDIHRDVPEKFIEAAKILKNKILTGEFK